MNRIIKTGVMAVALAAVAPAFAEELEEEDVGSYGWSPIAIGLASPVQLPWGHAKWDVYGFNLGLFYFGAPEMYGLGIGGLGALTTGDFAGWEISGLMNYNARDVWGLRTTLGANICRGTVRGADVGAFGYRNSIVGFDCELLGSIENDMLGCQIGGLANLMKNESYGCAVAVGVNIAQVAYGCQVAGIFNMAQELHGCQIGLVNFAERCPWGFQVGLVNFIMDNTVKVLPIVNAYF